MSPNLVSPNLALVIPIVALLIPMIIVPSVFAFRHARLDRELEHAERMKALELGRTLPIDEPWWTPGRLAAAIGVGVPVGVFFVAWLATFSPDLQKPVWIAAGAVGLSGVAGGTLLALRQTIAGERSRAGHGYDYEKPYVEADAYDVAGSRG